MVAESDQKLGVVRKSLKERKKEKKRDHSNRKANAEVTPRKPSERIARKAALTRSNASPSHRGNPPLTSAEQELFAKLVEKAPDASFAKVNGIDFPLGDEGLSDEVMNAYIKLINDREQRYWETIDSAKATPPFGRNRAYCFDTSFVKRLVGSEPKAEYNFNAVNEVTSRLKIDILQLEHVMFPVKVDEGIWKLIVLNLPLKEVYHLDLSHRRDKAKIISALCRWTGDEIEEKHGADHAEEFAKMKKWSMRHFSHRVYRSWDGIRVKRRNEITTVRPLENLNHSGVYILKLMDCIALGSRMSFSNDEIALVRQRIVLELNEGQLPVV